MILPSNFYARDTLTVALELLGKKLVKREPSSLLLEGIIVETEAYVGVEDKACHARWRKKETCFPMWGPGGFTYVYFTYGMYHMLNIVTEKAGCPSAVLIRALEPINGLDLMFKNRKVEKVHDLTSGPGKLTMAFGVSKVHNNVDLTKKGTLYISEHSKPHKFDVVTTTRIGIPYAEEYINKPWRFYIKSNKFVSGSGLSQK